MSARKSTTRVLAKKVKPNAHSRAILAALRRAAQDARKTARLHGTPIYVVKNGRIVAEKP